MEPSVETYVPSRLYARVGWAAAAGCLVCVGCGFRELLALIPAALCALTAGILFWFASRPAIRVGESQLAIGNRIISWRDIREINGTRFISPLVLRIRLTNARPWLLFYPGEPDQIARLMHYLRKNSYLATFDGVAYRDYWTWSNMTISSDLPINLDQPVRMLSAEDEEDVERMYQKLKSVGRLDARNSDVSATEDE